MKVTLWDSPAALPDDLAGKIILWQSYSESTCQDAISIPVLVEANAETLRKHFLAWIYEIGDSWIDEKPLVELLELRPGLSYWWMTLIAEKCNFAKSPLITDAIRFFAFDDWAREVPKITSVTLVSANKPLHESFRYWCRLREVEFESKFIKPASEPKSLVRRTFDRLPYVVQAGISLLKYLIERWPLRGVGLDKWSRSESEMTFVSYMDNLIPESVRSGRYESRYWGGLPQQLRSEGCKTNWLHIYAKDVALQNSRKARDIINTLNKAARGMEIHVILDAFLSVPVVIRTIKDWFRLVKMDHIYKSIFRTSAPEAMNIWPLFIDDWRQSMCGQTAIANMLRYNLFVAAMSYLPKQQLGVYLQENQGWELLFIHSWKTAGHGRLVGCPHSTVRFWDLRYFFDPRSYSRTGKNPLPLPDCVAVNGKAATQAYLVGGYPISDLVEVEALRYQHLVNANTQSVLSLDLHRRGLRLLVLGDYLPINTQFQMELLNRAAAALPNGVVITVKPHPNCPIDASDYQWLRLQISIEPIATLLAVHDVAYVSAVTSAAVDAYCTGLPVISVLDPKTLNLSPLRGFEGVKFVSTPYELALAVEMSSAPMRGDCRDFFTLDDKLPRWKQLIVGEQFC